MGHLIEFDYNTNAKGYNDVVSGTVVVLKADAEVVEASKPKTFRSFGRKTFTPEGASKEKYWEDKAVRDIDTQKRIQKQASRNSAIEMASMFLAAGAIKLPENPGKRYEIIAALVQEWIDKFEAQIDGKEEPSEEITVTHPTADGSHWEAA